MMQHLAELAYLLAAVIFIIGLKWLSSPVRARKGNVLSAFGMLIAIVVTLLDKQIVSYSLIAIGLLIGTVLGIWMAYAVKMTAMPQMVGLLNGFGGGASLLVAAAEWYRLIQPGQTLTTGTAVTIYLSSLVGGVTIAGSVVAALKLQGWVVPDRPVLFPGRHALSIALILTVVAMGVYLGYNPGTMWAFIVLNIASLILGVQLVIAIGGADQPVVICLLNSYAGIAAAMTGFVINNHGLIITGALVGASGIILTNIMCKAMNRSVWNVLFGGVGVVVAGSGGDKGAAMRAKGVRTITAEDTAALLGYGKLVIVVPGYGMAVAQAQHQVRELADLLHKRGVEVLYAIHPVAGRMPGHMNVLLAEANVPYESLLDLDQINPNFDRADVAIVIGANDVVNPAARHDTTSPIYGMPILDADLAQHIVVMKRSMNPGFAGIENELFYNSKTQMLFGDAKKSLLTLINEVRVLE
ncbi:MAG: NAD(P)(+) transhydrogenase (Re/Si-specific) subunit beta [Gemmatimonadaceae bacterium]